VKSDRGIVRCISTDRKKVVSTSGSMINIWDLETGNDLHPPIETPYDRVHIALLSPDEAQIASCSGSSICIWDVETGGMLVGPMDHHDVILEIAYLPDGKRLVVSVEDDVRILDVEMGEPVFESLQGHTSSAYCVAVSPDGKWIASGSEDGTVRIWRAETGELATGPHTHVIGVVLAVTFSPDSTLIASGSVEGMICLWDVSTGRLAMGPLDRHLTSVYSLAFSPDGKQLASHSDDDTIRVWDVVRNDFATPPDDALLPLTSAEDLKQRGVYQWKRPMSDGWVENSDEDLILWMPPDYRKYLVQPPCRFVIPYAPAKVTIDVNDFVHGLEWTRCFKAPNPQHTA